jgi:hypothetical protein
MRTAAEYLQKRPHARPATIAHREKVAATVEQLQREIAAKGMASRPRSETTVRKMMRGIAALMARTKS